MSTENMGFDPEEIAGLKEEIQASGNSFIINEDEPQGDEFAHFFFVGKHEGREVIYDAVLYSLRLEHSSKVYELADEKAAEKFPNYKKWEFEEDENGELVVPDDLDEEVETFKAELIMEMEEEETVKVKEHIDLDTEFEYGIGLEACLNVEAVTEEVIEKFVTEFNNGTLKLDPTMYSFQSDEEDDFEDED